MRGERRAPGGPAHTQETTPLGLPPPMLERTRPLAGSVPQACAPARPPQAERDTAALVQRGPRAGAHTSPWAGSTPSSCGTTSQRNEAHVSTSSSCPRAPRPGSPRHATSTPVPVPQKATWPRELRDGVTPSASAVIHRGVRDSTGGAGSSLRLRGTTQDRPAGRPPRPHPLGHARKALGPRVRPRHPPGGPRESTARVSPGPAQRSRPPRLSRLLRPRPRRAFQACTRTGRGTWDHPAPSRGPWACYLDVRGAQTLSAPACGRGARDLRLDCRADPPLGRRLAAADPGASRLRVRRRGSRPAGGGRLLKTRLLAEPAARGWETGPRATHPRRKQDRCTHRSQSLVPFSFPLLLERDLRRWGADRTGGCTAGDPVLRC
ncbi:translation initiation factor IF-2-like [Rhinolophus ferrumequinum]|uniref:translation initiation factor IF-2-like n=1 Tax=Rhinolophus ferrumequinum TaxID=59479 RepID=UPI00140FE420|nr:translation initiation factor IF-2-like [Rhinolophus ferrumequinum]